MKIPTILHPEYLFIKKEDLQKDSAKEFVANLDNFIKVVEDIGHVEVLWSKLLGLKICQESPWSKIYGKNFPKQLAISFKARFYPFFNDHVTLIADDEISKFQPCESKPELTFFMDQILDETKKIISYATEQGRTIFVINNDKDYKFFYNNKKLNVKLLNSPQKLYQNVNYENLWPKNKNDIGKIEECLKIYLKKSGKKPLGRYSFRKQFISDILNATKKNQIIDKLGKRIGMSLIEAKSKLNDHEVDNPNTKRKERRFHIDRGSSVHYVFSENNISFERYYPASKHDNALHS